MNFNNYPSREAWKKVGARPRHGINLPLFSLHSKNSSGIGEFFDLIPLIDWCSSARFDVIQLLPLNDSGSDASPYNAISSCALNPIYISLHKLPGAKIPSITPNDSPRFVYNDVQSFKLNFLRNYCEIFAEDFIKKKSFKNFVKNNSWLYYYSLFKVLKDRLGQNSWTSWPQELKQPDYQALFDKHAPEMLIYILIQYLASEQLLEVKDYASSKNVLLEGDIPILISPDSSDAWMKPDLFDFSLVAGAPPDNYNQNGQYWGFPIFNWDIVKKEDFNWWKTRLEVASQYYDLYRIDHVVGFFHIWAIPLNRPAKEGHFIPENPSLWIPQGEEILQMMLKASPMLPIAEDLGTVPPSVRACLQRLGICGTKVMRWERHYDGDKSFIPLGDYPEISLTTVSTHDSETLQLWWQNPHSGAKDFSAFKGWTYSPDLSFTQRLEILHDAHHTPSLFHINLLQEYLALFPELCWPNPLDERINTPGTVLPTNWTCRFRPSIEDIISHKPLKEALQKIL
jgi:4-alpha-glucanotransferase